MGKTGTTWIYAYDRGGNILSKTAYEFTTGTLGTAVRSYLYGYTDSNWKDKLTVFDNSTITYDAIMRTDKPVIFLAYNRPGYYLIYWP